MRGRVFVNVEKCLTCKRCKIACTIAHAQSDNIYEAMFEDPPPRPRIRITALTAGGGIPNACRQCEAAACMMVCPSGAIHRNNSADPVVIDNDACVGCRSCVVVCPYGVPEMNHLRSSVVKCDLCIERLDQEIFPACVEACPTGALTFQTEEDAKRAAKSTPSWAKNPYDKVENEERG